MKSSHIVSFALGLAVMLGVSMIHPTTTQAQPPNHTFEMRTYYAMPGKLDDLKKRFRDHTITIFNRHHMKSVGYWEPQDNKENYLVYILEHASKEEEGGMNRGRKAASGERKGRPGNLTLEGLQASGR